MEYLVTRTTHVPEGTPDEAVADVRAREAAHSRELAEQGRLLPPDPRLRVATTALTPHPGDPGLVAS